MDERPRPNDHLVEPILAALHEVEDAVHVRGPRRLWLLLAVVAVSGIGALGLTFLALG